MAQPFGGFAKTLLEPQEYPEFREYPGGPLKTPYDVVGHTLPYLMGVEAVGIEEPFRVDARLLQTVAKPSGSLQNPNGSFGFAWGHSSNDDIVALNRLLGKGYQVSWAAESFTAGGREFPCGTMLVANKTGLRDELDAASRELLVEFTGLDAQPPCPKYRLKNTRLLNKMMWFKTKTQSPDSLRNGVGVTTPEDTALLYERIAQGEITNRDTCDQMIAILKRQKYNSIIPGQLPMEEVPGIEVAHKTGSVGNAVIDAGIVSTPKFDYVIALFADGADEEQWQRMLASREPMAIPGDNENWPGVSAASRKLAKISRMVFDEFYGWTEEEGKTK